jgi:hypothetical protein
MIMFSRCLIIQNLNRFLITYDSSLSVFAKVLLPISEPLTTSAVVQGLEELRTTTPSYTYKLRYSPNHVVYIRTASLNEMRYKQVKHCK